MLASARIDRQAEVVIAARQREPGLFVREQPIDDHELIALRRVDGAEHHGAVAEEHVHLAIEQPPECRCDSPEPA